MPPTTLLLLITGCLMLQPLSTDLYLASLPALVRDFGASRAAVQQTLSLFALGFGCAQLVSGPLSDRFGRRPVLLGGLGVYVLASAGCALAPALGPLIAMRFGQAIGACTAVVVARAVIRDAYPPERAAHVISKAASIMGLVPMFGPMIGSHLQVVFGWRAAFVVHALCGAGVAFAALRLFRETNLQRDPQAIRPRRLAATYFRIAGTPSFWAYTLPGAMSFATLFVFLSGASFALIEVLGVPTEYFGYCMAIAVTGFLSGTFACRAMLRRIGLQRTLGAGVVIGLASGLGFLALVSAGAQHWAVVVGAMFWTKFAHGINFSCGQAGATAAFPRETGAAAGLFGFVAMFAGLCAGTLVGASHDGTLLPLALIEAGASVLLAASAWITSRHRRVG